MTTKKRYRGAGFVAAGWIVMLGLFCSAERLMDSFGGWCIALLMIGLAFALMRAGEWTNQRRRTSPTPQSR